MGANGRRLRRNRIMHLLVLASLLISLVPIASVPRSAQVPLQSASAQTADGITYVYDELGRLVAVVDPATDAAVYTYDAVGNITKIDRHAVSQLSIIAFTPTSGAVGTSVTIWGTGFSAMIGENSVSFNGSAATVTSASLTQLVTTVPAGVASGTLNITTPSGSVTSDASFTVRDVAPPTIGSVSATIASQGSTVTVSGSRYEADAPFNNVAVNGTRAQVTSATASELSITVPPTG